MMRLRELAQAVGGFGKALAHGWGDTANTGASGSAAAVASWNPRAGSADADMLPDLDALVPRSRDLERNNGIAKGILTTKSDNVVGTGLRLVASPDHIALGWSTEQAAQWARKVESRWKQYWWSRACHAGNALTGDQISQQIFRSKMMNGAALALPLWIPDYGDGFSTKFQTIESDRLDTPYGLPESAKLRKGIVFNDYGAPTAYWIMKNHPGDRFRTGFMAGADAFELIPRFTPFGRYRVLHMFDSERSGQTTGKPLFSSILGLFKQIDRYTEAELAAAVANSMIAMAITTPMSEQSILELFDSNHSKYLDERRKYAVGLSSGRVMHLFPGDEMKSFIPGRPASGFGAFCDNIYRIIGCGTGLPMEWVTRNWTQSNYASQRAALLEVWRGFIRERDDLATQWYDPAYELFLEEQIDAGFIEAPDFYANKRAYLQCQWIGPARGWMDETKEATAVGLRIQIGVSTLKEECAKQGLHWRDVLEQQALEAAYRAQLGLPEPVPVQQMSVSHSGIPDSAPAPNTPGVPDQSKTGT